MIIPNNVMIIPNQPRIEIFSCKKTDAIIAVNTKMSPPPKGDKKLIFARVIARIYNNTENTYKKPDNNTTLLKNNSFNPSKLNISCIIPELAIESIPYLIRI